MNKGIKEIFKRQGLTVNRKFGRPSTYVKAFPESTPCFDAQVFSEDTYCKNKDKIQSREAHTLALWTGDLDLTYDTTALESVAMDLGCVLYITDIYGELIDLIYYEQ